MKTILSALGLSLLIFSSCGGQKKAEVDFECTIFAIKKLITY